MANQPPLFVESWHDALRAIVQQLGGAKTVGAILWPHKSVQDARTLLLNCLNPDRNEKLDPDQVVLLLRLAREADFHLAKHYLDAETGYMPSAPASPQDEQARLVAVIESAGQTLQSALTALDRLRERKPVSLKTVA